MRRVLQRIRLILIAVTQLAWCAYATGQPAPADPRGLQRQIDALRAEQAELRAQIQELSGLLRRNATSPIPAVQMPAGGEARLSVRAANVKGSSRSNVVIVEFSDFQCPFCARHAATAYREILRDFVDTGRARYAFMHFPIDAIHPRAYLLHIAAACAGEQGRFWEMHERLFAVGTAGGEALAPLAAAIGLDQARFDSCTVDLHYAELVRDAANRGREFGVTGTPTFVVGILESDDTVRAIRVIVGAKPYPVLREAIEAVAGLTARPSGASPASRLAITPPRGGKDALAR